MTKIKPMANVNLATPKVGAEYDHELLFNKLALDTLWIMIISCCYRAPSMTEISMADNTSLGWYETGLEGCFCMCAWLCSYVDKWANLNMFDTCQTMLHNLLLLWNSIHDCDIYGRRCIIRVVWNRLRYCPCMYAWYMLICRQMVHSKPL